MVVGGLLGYDLLYISISLDLNSFPECPSVLSLTEANMECSYISAVFLFSRSPVTAAHQYPATPNPPPDTRMIEIVAISTMY